DHLLHIRIRVTTDQTLQRARIVIIDRRDALLNHRFRTTTVITPLGRGATIIILAEEKSRRRETRNQQRNNGQHTDGAQRHPQRRLTLLLRRLWRHPTRPHSTRRRPELALLSVRVRLLTVLLTPLLSVRVRLLTVLLTPLLPVRVRLLTVLLTPLLPVRITIRPRLLRWIRHDYTLRKHFQRPETALLPRPTTLRRQSTSTVSTQCPHAARDQYRPNASWRSATHFDATIPATVPASQSRPLRDCADRERPATR